MVEVLSSGRLARTLKDECLAGTRRGDVLLGALGIPVALSPNPAADLPPYAGCATLAA